MIIHLGYACITNTLDISTSKTISFKNFSKDYNYNLIDNLIKENLTSLKEIIKYNNKNNIHFYRISSAIIPLATHPNININYQSKYKKYYQEIIKEINKKNIRLDMHLSYFCILNSTRKDVIKNTIKEIEYHYNILNNLNIKNKLLILHIGSNTFGKENSITRFINSFNNLPEHLKKSIAIENDDKTFTIDDCLLISDKLNIPVILDYHHFNCNNINNNIEIYLNKIFNTWNDLTPKIHFSSPKNKKDFRSHHDYINVDDFINFINILKKYNKDIDIMLEAKQKDEALFKLIRELKYKTNYTFLDETTIYIK